MSGLKSTNELIDEITQAFRSQGFDLVQAFDIAHYNAIAISHEALVPVQPFGRSGALALLVGNTKALWPHFTEAYRASEELQRDENPLDRWVETVVSGIIDKREEPCVKHYSHSVGDDFVSMLHLAESSGIAKIGPAQLAAHPTYGPWFALRCVLVFDRDAPQAADQLAFPCEGCVAPCMAALQEATAVSGDPSVAGFVRDNWEDWLAVREVCPVGREHRYSDNQIIYHYARERAGL